MLWSGVKATASKRTLEQGGNTSSSVKKQCLWPCPACGRWFPSSVLDDHVQSCFHGPGSSSTRQFAPAAAASPCATEWGGDAFMEKWTSSENRAGPQDPSSNVAEPGGGIGRRETRGESDTSSPASLARESVQVLGVHDRSLLSLPQPLSSASLLGEALLLPEHREGCEYEMTKQRNWKNEKLEGDGPGQLPEVYLDLPDENRSYFGETADVQDSFRSTTSAAGPDDVQTLKDGNGRNVERPPAGFKLYQRQKTSQAKLSMFFKHPSSLKHLAKPAVSILQPGMVLFRNWLDLDKQQRFVNESQKVVHLFHRPLTSGGGKYHIYSMCWGPKWNPKTHRYSGTGVEAPVPDWMYELAQEICKEAQKHTQVCPVDLQFDPDVALSNFYPVRDEKLGVIGLGGHQDLDDSCTMPVVSVSVGDSMTFFYRRLPPLSRRKSMIYVSVDESAAKQCEDGDVAHNREQQLVLRSGDVLVFGGKSRLIYHGTRHLEADTRPPGLDMVPGRLNFTFRQTDSRVKAQTSSLSSHLLNSPGRTASRLGKGVM